MACGYVFVMSLYGLVVLYGPIWFCMVLSNHARYVQGYNHVSHGWSLHGDIVKDQILVQHDLTNLSLCQGSNLTSNHIIWFMVRLDAWYSANDMLIDE